VGGIRKDNMTSKVKKHPLLGDITGAISERLPECTEEVAGVKYKMRRLKPEAEDWVASNTPGTTLSAAMLNIKKPTIAAALLSIDAGGEEGELPVEKLFMLPDEMDLDIKEQIKGDPKLMRGWRREQVLEWLREEHDSYVVDRLYEAYLKLIPTHREAIKAIEDFLKRTPSAESSAT
jgi:hypothetical protein